MEQAQVLENVECCFVDSEVVCPYCGNYNVEEGMHSFYCIRCGNNWANKQLNE